MTEGERRSLDGTPALGRSGGVRGEYCQCRGGGRLQQRVGSQVPA
jgi:hypothetical protein